MSYLARPSAVLWEYLSREHAVDRDPWCHRWFQYGELGVALELITLIKNLEQLPVVSDRGRAESVSALQTLLTDMEISDLAWEMYEKLGEWRRVKFLPVVPDERVPEGIAVVVGPDDDGLPTILGGLSSSPAAPEAEPSLPDVLHVLAEERRSRDEKASDE